MKIGNRIVSIILAVLMLLVAAPLAGFVGLEITPKAKAYNVGDNIWYGAYPQRRIAETTELSDAANSAIWKSYNYYTGYSSADGRMVPSDYMKFADYFCNGEKYRAVKFTTYRMERTDLKSEVPEYNIDSYQYRNGYRPNTIYYFKYEPLQWRVLDPNTGLIMCENIIDSQAYQNTIYHSGNEYYQAIGSSVYANDYATSSIRKWLNKDFYNTAFTYEQKENILKTTIDNSAYRKKYDSVSTNDKLFLPSKSEVFNSSYGFKSSASETDSSKRARGTSYARSQGLWVARVGIVFGDTNYHSLWWLRSPGDSSSRAYGVDCYGDVGTGYEFGDDYSFSFVGNYTVNKTYYGVRPACRLAVLRSDISQSNSLYSEDPDTEWSTPIGITVNNLGMKIPCTYQDAYFARPPKNYNHKMAITSLALASSAMVSSEEHKKGVFNNPERDSLPSDDGSDDYQLRKKEVEEQFRAKEFYEAAGFENYWPRHYKEKPTENSIAFVMANKNIDEIQTTVISIAIRGGGYDAEWGGNFNVGTAKEHHGFSAAADIVLSDLDWFLVLNNEKIKYKDNIKYWITGYSRSAAVGNLVAAKLTSGNIDSKHKNVNMYLPKTVYAYLFEPPKPTKDVDAKNSIYNNIFNIVNREDPVPRVAPGEWGYKRYGIDCYLPSRETYSDSNYPTLFNEMKDAFYSVSGEQYKSFFSSEKSLKNNDPDYHDFVFYDLTGDRDSIWANCGTGLILNENHSFSQGLFYDNLIHFIASGMKSSENFSSNYQQSLTKLLDMVMSAGQYDTPIKDRLKQAFDSYFNDISTMEHISLAIFLGIIDAPSWVKNLVLPDDFITKTLVEVLYDVLKSEGVSKDSVESMVTSTLKGVLPPLALHYNYVVSALKNICNLVSAHFTQTTAAWMLALDGVYHEENEKISKVLSHESTYRVATINCPVNVLVWDKSQRARALINGSRYIGNCDNPLSAYIDENGQKCVVLPNDYSYYFQFTGYDEGEMSVSFSTYDFETGEKLESVNYYDIPIHPNTEIRGTLYPKSEEGISDDIRLYENWEEIEPSELVANCEESQLLITARSDNDHCSAFGGGAYCKGEFSQVTALNAPGYVFAGWYEQGTIVSQDIQYRFRVESNRTLVAHFKPCSHEYSYECTLESTCTAEGMITYTCSRCDEIYTEPIPVLQHADTNNDGKCDTCNQKMTGGQHCKYCGKIHGGAFGWLTKFFHSILAIFKR